MLCAGVRILRSQLVVLVDSRSQSSVGSTLSTGAHMFDWLAAPQLEGDGRGRDAPNVAERCVAHLPFDQDHVKVAQLAHCRAHDEHRPIGTVYAAPVSMLPPPAPVAS
jgi:hypothetical protein